MARSSSRIPEILDPWYSHGLDSILNERRYKLSGILNGIDTVGYDPATDKCIKANFSADDISGKKIDKEELQKEMGLPVIKLIQPSYSSKEALSAGIPRTSSRSSLP